MCRSLLACSVVLCLAGCQGEAPTSPETPTETQSPLPAAATQQAPADAISLVDVVETSDRYIIGINYPELTTSAPGLAHALKDYAEAVRSNLMQALSAVEVSGEQLRAPYDLSLNFTTLHASPQLVVIAADGSMYTGGAHGAPLVERFVWLPEQQSMLAGQELFSNEGSWQAIFEYVREHLHAELTQQVEAIDMTPQARQEMVSNGSEMINAGSAPEAGNFDLFEPVVDEDGNIASVRFVFPPYQVGPYSDGTRAVEMPARLLLPFVAPAYRHLFAGVEAARGN